MTENNDQLEARLSQIIHGASSPAPASDPDLDPLLLVAKRLHAIGAMAPSPTAVQRIRVAIRQAAAPETRPSRTWWPRLATAVPVAIVLMVAGTVTALAAPSALPDSPLYAVRGVRETLQIRLAGTPAERASLYATFAQQRADQLRRIARAKDASPQVVTTLLRDISSQIHSADAEARDAPKDTRAAIHGLEGQIESDLTQVQSGDTLSPDASQQLNTTIHDVQSGESTNAAEPNQSPDSTGTSPQGDSVTNSSNAESQ
jgi:uncharacterized protein DUF5667